MVFGGIPHTIWYSAVSLTRSIYNRCNGSQLLEFDIVFDRHFEPNGLDLKHRGGF